MGLNPGFKSSGMAWMLSFVKVARTSVEMKMLVHIGMLPWTKIALWFHSLCLES